jgi:predicted DNA-binding protein
MNTSLIVRMDKEKKERFDRMARRRGKTSSEVIREFVESYVERNDMRGYLGKLMDEIGADFKKRGITQKDIDRAIKEDREEQRAKSR